MAPTGRAVVLFYHISLPRPLFVPLAFLWISTQPPWDCPASADGSWLRHSSTSHSSLLVLDGTHLPQRGMPPRVVEALDVLEDPDPHAFAARPRVAVEQFPFERRNEGFGRGVVRCSDHSASVWPLAIAPSGPPREGLARSSLAHDERARFLEQVHRFPPRPKPTPPPNLVGRPVRHRFMVSPRQPW